MSAFRQLDARIRLRVSVTLYNDVQAEHTDETELSRPGCLPANCSNKLRLGSYLSFSFNSVRTVSSPETSRRFTNYSSGRLQTHLFPFQVTLQSI